MEPGVCVWGGGSTLTGETISTAEAWEAWGKIDRRQRRKHGSSQAVKVVHAKRLGFFK